MDEWNTDCAPLWMPYLVSLGCHFKPLNAIHDFVILTLFPPSHLGHLLQLPFLDLGWWVAMTRCVTPNWSQNSFTKAIQGSSLANLTAALSVAVDSQFTSRKLNCSTSRPTSFIFIPSLLWPIVGSYARHCHWLAARRSSSFGTAKRTWRGSH